jgi:hypothetical protein
MQTTSASRRIAGADVYLWGALVMTLIVAFGWAL